MIPRSLLVSVVFFLGLVINPAYFAGCSSGDAEGDSPGFGEAEMLMLLDAANETGTWEFDVGDKRYAIDLVLSQSGDRDMPAAQSVRSAAFAMRAHACGTRRFTNSAAACITVTEVPVEGELSLRQVAPVQRTVSASVEVRGVLLTRGDKLLSASMSLEFEGGKALLHSPDARAFKLSQFKAAAAGPDDAITFGDPTLRF